ncbi:hypothetical protein BJV82DRAFT_676018 [Fennellomyces sp. T-0311]|nr:hypothetical protein BJV82DRAFT_676018 [Fennellomyces sp. T-0311]
MPPPLSQSSRDSDRIRREKLKERGIYNTTQEPESSHRSKRLFCRVTDNDESNHHGFDDFYGDMIEVENDATQSGESGEELISDQGKNDDVNPSPISVVSVNTSPVTSIKSLPSETEVNQALAKMGRLTEIEQDIAQFSLAAELSKSHYKWLFAILNKTCEITHSSGQLLPLGIGTKDALNQTLDIDAGELDQPFQEERINPEKIPDILEKHQAKFAEMAGEITLQFRNIRKLVAHMFRDRTLWDSMILEPVKQYREWWERLQLKLPDKNTVVLAIMLSSDQTTVCHNGRHKVWPLYIKLANVPMSIRDKEDSHATRLLAYMPVIKFPGKTPPPWWKKEFFEMEIEGPKLRTYKCVPALATYSADLPEQTIDQMKSRYEDSLNIIGDQGISAGLEYAKEESINIVENAFWTIPNFDIYDAMIVDDLHQLGGIYQYLLHVLEDILVQQRKQKEVERRVLQLPKFRGLRQFTTGYLLSRLKNPTFTELKDHMSILLACIHDLVPMQVVLCIRHFIDFFYQATAREHTTSTLRSMNESLDSFRYYSPILQAMTGRKLNFPKNHMIQKYAADIRSRGIIAGYSTNHSEHQHRDDAKRPARRTNYHRQGMPSQMVKYIRRRDLLRDCYSKLSPVTQFPECNANHRNKTAFKLCSPLKRSSVYIDEVASIESTLSDAQKAIEVYFDHRSVEGTPDLENAWARDKEKIHVYQSLKIKTYDDDGDAIEDIIRAHPKFHGKVWRDFVMLKDEKTIRQIHLFFKFVDGARESFACVIQTYKSIPARHASGFEVFKPGTTGVNGNLLSVIDISDIYFPVHVVPDFSAKNEAKYLVNHDVTRFNWSKGKGQPRSLPRKDYYGWADLENDCMDVDGNDSSETETDEVGSNVEDVDSSDEESADGDGYALENEEDLDDDDMGDDAYIIL